MQNYPKSKFIENVFSMDEINEIIDHFKCQPVAHHYVPQNTLNKNLDYDIPGSVVNRIVKPKLSEILNDSDHRFFGGAYKEYTIPYSLHIDNVIPTASMTFADQPCHKTAFLIPLIEDVGLKTAMFDVFLPVNHNFRVNGDVEQQVEELKLFLTKQPTIIDSSEFDHIQEPFWSLIPYIPVDRIQQWKLGSIITWHFDQLHCSTNFQKLNITKKFMVIMIN
jgi:hypothetical protein